MDIFNKKKIKDLTLQLLMTQSELHNAIANSHEDRCGGDKSDLSMYMNFIYRLKSLEDDLKAYNIYDVKKDDTNFIEKSMITKLKNRIDHYNDYIYLDELNEKSFEAGYWIDSEGDYIWKQDDKSYEEKYAELIKCILNQLNQIDTESIEDRFPKLVKLIERNKKVCIDKIKELENKQE